MPSHSGPVQPDGHRQVSRAFPPSLPEVSGDRLWGSGELVPCEEGLGLVSGNSEAALAGGLLRPQCPSDFCPASPGAPGLVQGQGTAVPPGWAAARLHLPRAFALHQDRPGNACGHLEEGQRLQASSNVGCGQYLLQKPLTLPPGPSPPPPPRGLAGRGGQARGCGRIRASSSARRFSGLSFPVGGRAREGIQIAKDLRFRFRGLGPALGRLRGVPAKGRLGWAAGGCWGLRAADKAAAPPRGAGQWNEWAINSRQWAARVAPLKSLGRA
uniref:uncharacterized protein LOC128928883 n=1 Tax=Callithrix jacchus TaxID=9483 RepID=UPI0023DD4B31|nr:uncharacterized protein LOC128928883 [Callithrix jacchus]